VARFQVAVNTKLSSLVQGVTKSQQNVSDNKKREYLTAGDVKVSHILVIK
jgi:hypothetical protein